MVLGLDHAWAAGEEVGGQVGGRRARPREENGSRGKKTQRAGRPRPAPTGPRGRVTEQAGYFTRSLNR